MRNLVSRNTTNQEQKRNSHGNANDFDGALHLTTQAQRPGPRGRPLATWTRWPGSLQRMVRPLGIARQRDETVTDPRHIDSVQMCPSEMPNNRTRPDSKAEQTQGGSTNPTCRH